MRRGENPGHGGKGVERLASMLHEELLKGLRWNSATVGDQRARTYRRFFLSWISTVSGLDGSEVLGV